MRKLIIAQYASLDGVVESPEQWHFPYADENMFRSLREVNSETDTMLLGRVTYDVFAQSFAGAPADDPVAAEVNRPAKVLVSSTVTDPTWTRTTVVDGDVVDQIARLKEQPGSGILVNGSIRLCRTLLGAGLVDEVHLFVHPIVVGHGRRLFAEDGPQVPLALTASEVFPTGVLSLRYRVTGS
jgi:dihydrofolate reductase